MQVSKVGVLGGGLMGHGIAQIAAQAEYDVVLRARSRRARPSRQTPTPPARASRRPPTTARSPTATS
jgi:3-hydroxyacyl-CoA dehydrogenase